MNKPKISVILPCYHVAQYLAGIFQDLKAQTFEDFEMLFVNDGDEKLSPMLADLARQDSRVTVIEKKNGGLCSARNAGLDKANGEWIVFVDPDDRLKPYYLRSLYDAVAETGLAIGVGGFKEHFVGQGVWVDHTLKGITPPLLQGTGAHKALLKDCYFHLDCLQDRVVWDKIFNAEFLRKHNLRFDLAMTTGEDTAFSSEAFYLVDSIALVPECGYRYIQNTKSLTKQYRPNYKFALERADALQDRLFIKLGKTKEEMEARYVKRSAFNVYVFIINYFKLGNGLSFRQKVARIREEILGDGHLMGALRTHRLRWEGPNVTMCTHLVLTRQAWMVAAVFQLLFFLKNHFMGLFCWYDAHLSGKLKK